MSGAGLLGLIRISRTGKNSPAMTERKPDDDTSLQTGCRTNEEMLFSRERNDIEIGVKWIEIGVE